MVAAPPLPAGDVVTRFSQDLDRLTTPDTRIGVAVSGGPDSVALLLLAAASRPGQVEAATVDHRLRPEGAAESQAVAELCAALGVPHAILPITWDETPSANLQARARAARYGALTDWAQTRGLGAIATAHHADDQAETLLMRLARGAGLGGLAGVRARRGLASLPLSVIRPLLGWRRDELRAIVDAAGIAPADDPANRDLRHDRTRARAFLAAGDWPDPLRLAASAHHLAEAEEALQFAAARLYAERHHREGEVTRVDAAGLPRELRRRLLLIALARRGAPAPPGPDIVRLLAALDAGRTATLAGLKLTGGPAWRIEPAPARRA